MKKLQQHILLFVLVLFGAVNTVLAQTNVTVTLKSDSDHILIGDQLKLQVTVKHPKTLKILMPSIKDSVGNMDFIRSGKIDTIDEPTDRIFSQTYIVSAYDSGIYHAGPVAVVFKNADGVVDSAFSNVLPIAVNTVPVDTVKPIKPIKAPLEVPYSWREFLPYILAAWLLIALIAVAVVLWLRYKKQKPAVQARPKPKDPAHIWARKELKKLEDEKLWQKDSKQYYSKLTDILRLYLEYRFNWFALESTTEEIQQDMAGYNLKEKAKDSLLDILRLADLVKFAKMMPGPEANIKAMENANRFIDFTEPKEEAEKK